MFFQENIKIVINKINLKEEKCRNLTYFFFLAFKITKFGKNDEILTNKVYNMSQ